MSYACGITLDEFAQLSSLARDSSDESAGELESRLDALMPWGFLYATTATKKPHVEAVQDAERIFSEGDPHPAVMATACLNLLYAHDERASGRSDPRQSAGEAGSRPQYVSREAALQRLMEVLVAHPILMNPQFGYVVNVRRDDFQRMSSVDDGIDFVPMGCALADMQHMSLPSREHGFSSEVLNRFATARSVRAGLTAMSLMQRDRSRNIALSSYRGRRARESLIQQATTPEKAGLKSRFMVSLLALSARSASAGCEPYFQGDATGYAVESFYGFVKSVLWQYALAEPGSAAYPQVPLSRFVQACQLPAFKFHGVTDAPTPHSLYDMKMRARYLRDHRRQIDDHIFFARDFADVPDHTCGALVEARKRIQRCLDVLTEAGLLGDRSNVAAALLEQGVRPVPASLGGRTRIPHFERAMAFLEELAAAGASIPDDLTLIGASRGAVGAGVDEQLSFWQQVNTSYQTKTAMSKVLDEVSQTATQDARRRASV